MLKIQEKNYKLSKTKQLMWQTVSYSNATDNFKVEKLPEKVRRICENGAQNLPTYACRILHFWRKILTT